MDPNSPGQPSSSRRRHVRSLGVPYNKWITVSKGESHVSNAMRTFPSGRDTRYHLALKIPESHTATAANSTPVVDWESREKFPEGKKVELSTEVPLPDGSHNPSTQNPPSVHVPHSPPHPSGPHSSPSHWGSQHPLFSSSIPIVTSIAPSSP